ncbi:MAG TPA: DUF4388 domain-containing protein [Actinomycetota bacterium]|nr:DUF4388 domain-containing protein [Actinomycetota bacterium]
MFLNGSLENFSVADILQLLSFSKQTGALHVTGEVTGVLYLDDGEVYFATEEDAAPLEDTVVAAGIPREDWNAALESAGHSHAAGRALMERGVAADLIGYVVHHIVSDTAFELVRMPRAGGSFDFRVGELHPVGPAHKLRVDELVAEVRDRLAEWDAISEFISSPSDMVSATSELAEDSVELSVSREQWALLVATIRNDRATVSELARATDRSEAEVASALHPLISSGLMEVEAHAEAVVLDSFDSPPAPDSSDSDYSDEVVQEVPSREPSTPQEQLSWWGDQPAAEGLPSDQEGLPSDQEETTLSWEPLESQPEGLPSDQPEGLPSDQAEGLAELEIVEPVGSELDEWRFDGDSQSDPLEDRENRKHEQEPVGDSEPSFSGKPEADPEETALSSDPESADPLDTRRPLFESEQAEETDQPDPLTEAPAVEATVWDLEGGTDLEEKQAAEEQQEPPLSPAETIDVEPPEVENAGFRTLALQELRDLAGTAPVQLAPGSRQTNSRKPPAETSDEKPPSQPKVRALRRIIAAVRGL